MKLQPQPKTKLVVKFCSKFNYVESKKKKKKIQGVHKAFFKIKKKKKNLKIKKKKKKKKRKKEKKP